MAVRCTGCRHNFSISGYTGHVQRTASPSCIAAYQAQLRHANDIESPGEEADSDNNDNEVFSGDFFGDYDYNELDWPDDGGLSSVAYAFSIHTYLEPGPPPEDEMRHMAANEELISIAAPASHSPAQDTRFKIEPFPLATAGAPIPGSAHHMSSFESYGRSLGSNEEYAPFCSKLDWDIARWAKIHGPSSSSVSKLLEIDGVCSLLWVI
jgi:hypothetical protein